MKRLSIKLKITIWFTSFMIILAIIVFGLIALVANSTATQLKKNSLVELIDSNVAEVEYDDGELDIDDDYISFENGIYSMVFDESGQKLMGNSPAAELEALSFEDGSLRSINAGGQKYLVYDRLETSKKYSDLWVRGVVPEGGNAIASSATYRAALIALPLLVAMAAVGGYVIAWRSLRPIQKIGQTADSIAASGDLSKRIEMGNGMGENGDELDELAQAFNNMFEQLEGNFEAEQRFTSDASHELRTPVAIIMAQCEFAFENAKTEEELYEALGSIQKQGYRMSRLIESLLRFTRLEQQTEKPEFELTDLSAAVLNICNEQKQLDEKNIVMNEDVQLGIRMKADAGLFSQMVSNLIRNAYVYGVENGHIYVNLKQIDKKIMLTVADDGVGISKEELPNIWKRFYRADKSRRSSSVSGFGLGLSMVQQIAKLHGGNIDVKSEPGKGTEFRISFDNDI